MCVNTALFTQVAFRGGVTSAREEMWGRVEEDPPEIEPDMQNMTTNVIQETYNVLRNTLGRDFDTLASVTVIVMLWQVLRSVQRRIEDVIFVQMSVGDELDDGGGSN